MPEMSFASSRGGAPRVSLSHAMAQGLAPDGGLYVPCEMPTIDVQALPARVSLPEIARLSHVDLAVEVASKEADFDRARVKNYVRVERLAAQGRRFRNFLEQEGCWYWEVFGFLKRRNRVIALADYSVEKTFVLTVPHRFLIGQPERVRVQSASSTPESGARKRRPRDCPF